MVRALHQLLRRAGAPAGPRTACGPARPRMPIGPSIAGEDLEAAKRVPGRFCRSRVGLAAGPRPATRAQTQPRACDAPGGPGGSVSHLLIFFVGLRRVARPSVRGPRVEGSVARVEAG
jgi:hypothetical protein